MWASMPPAVYFKYKEELHKRFDDATVILSEAGFTSMESSWLFTSMESCWPYCWLEPVYSWTTSFLKFAGRRRNILPLEILGKKVSEVRQHVHGLTWRNFLCFPRCSAPATASSLSRFCRTRSSSQGPAWTPRCRLCGRLFSCWDYPRPRKQSRRLSRFPRR